MLLRLQMSDMVIWCIYDIGNDALEVLFLIDLKTKGI